MKLQTLRSLSFASMALTAVGAHSQTINSLDDAASIGKPSTTYYCTTASLTTGVGVVSGSGLKVNFPASVLNQNPNVVFVNTAGYNPVGKGGIAVTLTNVGTSDFALTMSLVDAAGSKFEGATVLAAGATETYRMDTNTATADPAAYKMKALPSPFNGMRTIKGYGAIDMSKLQMVRIFQRGPSAGGTLVIDDVRILPAFDQKSYLTGITDDFGQNGKELWRNKLNSASEFSVRDLTEQSDLLANPGLSDRDEYGGYLGAAPRAATGYFRTENIDGRWWIVDPKGRLFFSSGINGISPSMVTDVTDRSWMTNLATSALPTATATSTGTYDYYASNLSLKYGADYLPTWQASAANRLRSWGFNTVGAWSDTGLYGRDGGAYVVAASTQNCKAHLVSTGLDYWRKLPDPFDPLFAGDVSTTMNKRMYLIKDPSRCLGVMMDNELSWDGPGVNAEWGIAYGVVREAASVSPAKRALLAQLSAKYVTIASLNAAWGTSYASWTALESPLELPASPNAAQKADMDAFVLSFAQRYFSTVRDGIKAYLPNALYLGCRFAHYTKKVLQAADESCDVISFNYYANRFNATDFAFTQSLTKPCMISEFSFGATDRGLPYPGLVGTSGQTARANAMVDYVRNVAQMPNFVGAHWFQYADEPLIGRPIDGSNGNIGMVDVTDTPYTEMIAAARQVNTDVYRLHLGG